MGHDKNGGGRLTDERKKFLLKICFSFLFNCLQMASIFFFFSLRDSRLFDQLLSNVSSKGFDLFFAMEKSITCIEFDF